MNSIVFTHVAAPVEGASILDLALDRLGAYLDAERDTLGRLLAQVGRHQTSGVLEALEQLHLEPESVAEDLWHLLEHAKTCLEILLETLRGMSCRQGTVSAWGLPGPAAFDVHLRWSAARLTDILATLRHTLAA
ncbi:hypothetical protein ACN2XU_23785 [Primorskyibacter sp. 2E107]|uniref:hypothetical protein n=1 Tax=Primorskyibacter sp. 2E107 TaxID=3403458 RepID=UPI003AF6677F